MTSSLRAHVSLSPRHSLQLMVALEAYMRLAVPLIWKRGSAAKMCSLTSLLNRSAGNGVPALKSELFASICWTGWSKVLVTVEARKEIAPRWWRWDAAAVLAES